MTTHFDRAILNEEQRRNFRYSPPALIQCVKAERRLAKALVKQVLGTACQISISDGEDIILNPTTNSRAILNAMYTTGRDVLVLFDDQGRKVGWFELVYGNGHEVIADHADNDLCNTVFDRLHPPSRIAAEH